ncbi:hypothetical protein IWW50_005223, partial [Coemansia erecta]
MDIKREGEPEQQLNQTTGDDLALRSGSGTPQTSPSLKGVEGVAAAPQKYSGLSVLE